VQNGKLYKRKLSSPSKKKNKGAIRITNPRNLNANNATGAKKWLLVRKYLGEEART
jgi:hypothetical protein